VTPPDPQPKTVGERMKAQEKRRDDIRDAEKAIRSAIFEMGMDERARSERAAWDPEAPQFPDFASAQGKARRLVVLVDAYDALVDKYLTEERSP
jgi:hypothetical protein